MQLKEKAAFKAIWQNPRGVKNRKTGGEKTEKNHNVAIVEVF